MVARGGTTYSKNAAYFPVFPNSVDPPTPKVTTVIFEPFWNRTIHIRT